MSHEIRTPMIGVLGMAELLRQKDLDKQDQQLVETIYRSGEALLTIINDVLDFSKIEAGRLELDAVAVDLADLAGEVTRLLEVNAHTKGLEVLLETPGDLPIVIGDPIRIRQILLNLIGNAIKFTESGRVTVSLSVTCRPTEKVCDCLFVVQDTGIGIPEDVQMQIFDSFDQGDSSLSTKSGGTGLGLAIVKKLVQMMKGQVTVDSRPGEGSTFSVYVPMALAGRSELPLSATEQSKLQKLSVVEAPAVAVPVAADGSRRILLAEDNPTTQNLLSILLQQMGIKLTIVDNGQAAIDSLAKEKVDLIFMDCQMPQLDGFEATAQLRAQGLLTPIVALTAYARAEDEQQCLAVGMNDFLSKPFRQSELRSVITRWFGAEFLTEAPDS
jgi:CheY-like chemotaxis protein/two-component sensor histidine kinase